MYLPLSPTAVTYHCHHHCHLPLSPFTIQPFDSTRTDITSKAVQYKTTLGGLGAYITGLYLPQSPTTVTYHCHLPLSPFTIQAFDSTGTDITSKAVQYKTTLGGLGVYITGLYLPQSPTTVTYHCHLPLSPTTVTYHCHPSQYSHLIALELTLQARQFNIKLHWEGLVHISQVCTYHCHLPLSPTTVTYHCHLPLSPTTVTYHCHPSQYSHLIALELTLQARQFNIKLHWEGLVHISQVCTYHCHLPLSPTTVTYHCHPSQYRHLIALEMTLQARQFNIKENTLLI